MAQFCLERTPPQATGHARTSAMRMLPSPKPLSRSEEEPVSPLGVFTAFAGAMAPLRAHERLVHVSGFQYPKTTNVLLGFQIRAVGDEHFAIGSSLGHSRR
jgi:hypothetical protein